MNSIRPLALSALTALLYASASLPLPSFAQRAPAAPHGAPPAAAAVKSMPPPPEVQKAAHQWDTAIKLHKANKPREAIEAYKTFLHLVTAAKLPSSAQIPAYQNLVVLYRAQGQAKEMEGALQRWSALAPDNAGLHAELASSYTEPYSRRYEEASREAHKALALKPSVPVASLAHMSLGVVAVSNKDYAAAEQEFSEALKLTPDNAQVQFNYGLALTERKKYAPALTAMRRAAALNPKMVPARFYIGALLEMQQKYPEALAAYREAVKLAPGDPAILSSTAQLQLRMNDAQSALTSYLAALDSAPQNLTLRMRVADLYAQLRNFAAARIHYAEAHRIAPKEPRALLGLAQSELELSFAPQDAAAKTALLTQAESHYRAVVQLDPRAEVGQGGLAGFYERIGKFEKAQELYRKHLDANPNDYGSVNRIANLYVMQRKTDDAIAIWRKYRDAHPDEPAAYTRVATTLEAQARWKDAIAEWKLLLARKLKTGLSASVMVSIGKDLMRDGQKKEAAAQLEKALSLDTTAGDVPKEFRVAEAATVQAERLEAMRTLSQISETDKNYDDAIRWLQQTKVEEAALAEKNHRAANGQTYRDIARLYQAAKKPDLAIKELDAWTQIRQEHPDDYAPPFEELGQLFESLNRMDEAVAAYRKAVKYTKDPLGDRLRIAEIYQRSMRLPEAVAEYEAALKEFPAEPRILAPMALAYRQAGRDEDAISTYDALMKADPRARWALDQKAAVLTHLKRYSAARGVYEDELKRAPENRQLYADVAFVFQSEGKPDAFLDWAAPRYEKTPGNATLMAVVADEYIRQKREEAGWKYLEHIVDTHGTDRNLTESLASLMVQHNRKGQAIPLYQRIADQNPRDVNAQIILADQLYDAGRKTDAAKLYTGLIARADIPADQRLAVRRQYARTCALQGNTAEEISQLQEIVRQNPNDFEAATTLAQRLEAVGRDAEAIPIYLGLVDKPVYDAGVRAQLRVKIGQLYVRKGQKAEAATQFREALKLNPKSTSAQQALAGVGEK